MMVMDHSRFDYSKKKKKSTFPQVINLFRCIHFCSTHICVTLLYSPYFPEYLLTMRRAPARTCYSQLPVVSAGLKSDTDSSCGGMSFSSQFETDQVVLWLHYNLIYPGCRGNVEIGISASSTTIFCLRDCRKIGAKWWV